MGFFSIRSYSSTCKCSSMHSTKLQRFSKNTLQDIWSTLLSAFYKRNVKYRCCEIYSYIWNIVYQNFFYLLFMAHIWCSSFLHVQHVNLSSFAELDAPTNTQRIASKKGLLPGSTASQSLIVLYLEKRQSSAKSQVRSAFNDYLCAKLFHKNKNIINLIKSLQIKKNMYLILEMIYMVYILPI